MNEMTTRIVDGMKIALIRHKPGSSPSMYDEARATGAVLIFPLARGKTSETTSDDEIREFLDDVMGEVNKEIRAWAMK